MFIPILKIGKLRLKPSAKAKHLAARLFCPVLLPSAPAASVEPSCDSNQNEQLLSSLLHFLGNFLLYLFSSLSLLTSVGEEVQKELRSSSDNLPSRKASLQPWQGGFQGNRYQGFDCAQGNEPRWKDQKE